MYVSHKYQKASRAWLWLSDLKDPLLSPLYHPIVSEGLKVKELEKDEVQSELTGETHNDLWHHFLASPDPVGKHTATGSSETRQGPRLGFWCGPGMLLILHPCPSITPVE